MVVWVVNGVIKLAGIIIDLAIVVIFMTKKQHGKITRNKREKIKEIKRNQKKRKNKERGRWEGRSGLLPANRIGVGVHVLPSASAPRGSLSPKASPSPPPIYTGGFKFF